jgi:sulfur-oxidizing protein SoxX
MIPRMAWIASACVIAGMTAASAEVVAPDKVMIEEMTIGQSLTGQAGNPEAGRKAFANRKLGNCLACHANGDLKNELFHGQVGPPLDGVADRLEEPQMRAILVDSKQVLGEQTIMPSFYRIINDQRTQEKFHNKTILSAEHIEDIIAYLKTLKE